ncbi:DUF262 domain-containing protein [Cronobacter universalis]|nr:DUF262 domain-containing protein [Cronobacter universalis]
MTQPQKSLQEQIDEARMQVHTDSYPMSIGELINLYDDGELEIHPEFQRVYRWSDEQKSKLIESILLGIPLPSIFIAQRKDGIWDVVDGLQRISTILSFMGKLKDKEGNILPQLQLRATKYLPGLKGKLWENPTDIVNEIDVEIKRVFKREKLDIKIIKRESESDTKFELFQRLNTGGSQLSDQEVRNCMLLMLNPDAYKWLKELSSYENFLLSTPISEKQQEECYAQELALRFFVQRHTDENVRKEHSDVAPYLNAELTRIFKDKDSFDYLSEESLFKKTFDLAYFALEDNAFKKFNHNKARYEGAISLPVYEALTFAISNLIESASLTEQKIIEIIQNKTKDLTSNKDFIDILDKRVRPLDRMIAMSKIGIEVFK